MAALLLAVSACDRAATEINAPSVPLSLSYAKSVTASKSIHENFNTSVKAPSVLEATGTAPSYVKGAVTFDAYNRGYLRTIAGDYNTVSFTADVTVTVTSPLHGNGDGITFFGIGDGAPGVFFGEPATNAAVYARLMPSDFFGPAVELTTSVGGSTTYTRVEGLAGDGTHKVRIKWNAVTSELTLLIDNAVVGPVAVPGLFDGTNAHIFFGGAGNATFDDLHVVVSPDK